LGSSTILTIIWEGGGGLSIPLIGFML